MVAGSNANSLNLDTSLVVSWESDQKGGGWLLQRKSQAPNGVTSVKAHDTKPKFNLIMV